MPTSYLSPEVASELESQRELRWFLKLFEENLVSYIDIIFTLKDNKAGRDIGCV